MVHSCHSVGDVQLILGLDPGGVGTFGWCLCEYRNELPLPVVRHGTSNSAMEAVTAALTQVGSSPLIAAGIDAPLCWTSGARIADQLVRRAVAGAGCETPGGTVQEINSLRGACLVQGLLALRELRRRIPDLVVSEAHPKALLWLLGIPGATLQVRDVGPSHLAHLLLDVPATEHERDAALGALTAWAAVAGPPNWSDLLRSEFEPFFPAGSATYYMPLPRRRRDVVGDQLGARTYD